MMERCEHCGREAEIQICPECDARVCEPCMESVPEGCPFCWPQTAATSATICLRRRADSRRLSRPPQAAGRHLDGRTHDEMPEMGKESER